jgi:hypothetical protein
MDTFALVIGNNNYTSVNKLTNAVNDAKAIADVFEKLQYDITLMIDIKSNKLSGLLDKFEYLLDCSIGSASPSITGETRVCDSSNMSMG